MSWLSAEPDKEDTNMSKKSESKKFVIHHDLDYYEFDSVEGIAEYLKYLVSGCSDCLQIVEKYCDELTEIYCQNNAVMTAEDMSSILHLLGDSTATVEIVSNKEYANEIRFSFDARSLFTGGEANEANPRVVLTRCL